MAMDSIMPRLGEDARSVYGDSVIASMTRVPVCSIRHDSDAMPSMSVVPWVCCTLPAYPRPGMTRGVMASGPHQLAHDHCLKSSRGVNLRDDRRRKEAPLPLRKQDRQNSRALSRDDWAQPIR